MADLRPSEVETPSALNKQGRRKVTTIIIFIVVGVVFVFFVKSRRTKQDPVKAAQEKAIRKDESGGDPEKPSAITRGGKIDATRTAEEEAQFFNKKSEDDKATAERKAKEQREIASKRPGAPASNTPGGANSTSAQSEQPQLVPWGEDLPPGVSADGTAGSANAPGAARGDARRPSRVTYDNTGQPMVKIPMYDPSEYMMVEGVGLVRPSYLRGAKHPTTVQGHQTFESLYISSFGSPTLVGGGSKDDHDRLTAISAGFARIQGGVTPRSVPRKIVKEKDLTPAQIDSLRKLIEAQSGEKPK